MKVRAYAKINLALDVVKRREDGFHDLEMIMAPIFLHDLVLVDLIEEGIEITTNNRIIPTDERNIVYKVAALMIERFHLTKGVRIQIYKHIPMQAGLAGGSADGAAVLRAMNQMFHLHLSLEELAKIGSEVGSDIPFCVYQQFAFVKGRGEELDFFDAQPDYAILLVKPKRGVSTKLAFQKLNVQACDHPNCRQMRYAMEQGDDQTMIHCLGNSLEASSFQLVPEIQEIKNQLLVLGFDGALMSGSGSCVFALTKDPMILQKGYEEMRKTYPFVLRTRFKTLDDF